jgi:hypothetical protein
MGFGCKIWTTFRLRIQLESVTLISMNYSPRIHVTRPSPTIETILATTRGILALQVVSENMGSFFFIGNKATELLEVQHYDSDYYVNSESYWILVKVQQQFILLSSYNNAISFLLDFFLYSNSIPMHCVCTNFF